MAIFGILLDDNEAAQKFIEQTKERLKSNNLIKNPFTASIKSLDQIERADGIAAIRKLVILDIEPVYFPFPFLGVVASIPLLMITRWALIPLTIFSFFSLFWTSFFYYPVFKLGIKKAGYKGKVQRVKLKDIVRRLV